MNTRLNNPTSQRYRENYERIFTESVEPFGDTFRKELKERTGFNVYPIDAIPDDNIYVSYKAFAYLIKNLKPMSDK